MSKKLLIFVIAFTLILVAVVVWWLTKPSYPAPTVPPVDTSAPTETTSGTPLPTPPPLTPQQVAVANLKNSALRFAEMYGSYSTDHRYANFEAVDNLVTASMRQTMEAAKSDVPSEGFYSVTTKALIAKVENESDSTATVLVSTQRLESFSRAGEPQVRYPDVRLNLIRSGNVWLVDRAVWQ